MKRFIKTVLALPLLLAGAAVFAGDPEDDREPRRRAPGGPGQGAGRRLQAALDKHDADGDGRLSLAELGIASELFALLDANGDGFVDRADVRERHGRGPDGRRGSRGRRGDRGADGLMRMWKQMDTNRDGKITRDEWRGRAEFFERLDADSDGIVTEAEMQAVKARLSDRGKQGRTSSALLRHFDTDKDGRVSRTEWKLRIELFDAFDVNKDGFIDPEEVASRDHPARRRPDPKAFFRRFDKNGDGKITRDEFPSDRRFAEMDTNNDGVISLEEAERALGHRAKESDFGLLDRYDADGDGQVTREEFTGPGGLFDRLDKNGDGVIDRRDKPDRKRGPDRKEKRRDD